MIRRSALAFALLCFLGTPICAFAEAPESVTGLQAHAQEDGSIAVQWTPSAGEIATYRVYFSQKSILENDGYYDDVEMTDGPATTHILSTVPSAFQTVYVGVMAVNTQGEESPFFMEEVRVQRATSSTAASSSSDMSSSVPPTTTTDSQVSLPIAELQTAPTVDSLHLLSAQALSATGVALAFSAAPVIDPLQAPAAFSIIDMQGAPLPIEQLTMEGETITVQTARQVAGAVYQLRLTEPLAGEGGLPLDSIDRTAFFTGHSTGLSTGEAAAQPRTGSLPDVVNFRLQVTPQSNQLFMVTGQWEYDPSLPDGAFIAVRQSRDGGNTFSPSEFLPGNFNGVQIPDVTPQNFGLAVYVVDAEGHSSPGVFQSVFSGDSPQTIAPTTATVTPPPTSSQSVSSASTVTAPSTPKADNLTQSGAGAMLAIAAAGALLGWRKLRNTAPRSR